MRHQSHAAFQTCSHASLCWGATASHTAALAKKAQWHLEVMSDVMASDACLFMQWPLAKPPACRPHCVSCTTRTDSSTRLPSSALKLHTGHEKIAMVSQSQQSGTDECSSVAAASPVISCASDKAYMSGGMACISKALGFEQVRHSGAGGSRLSGHNSWP